MEVAFENEKTTFTSKLKMRQKDENYIYFYPRSSLTPRVDININICTYRTYMYIKNIYM